MPRLTPRDYLIQRHFLCDLWGAGHGGSFAVLPLQQQLDLHDFYAPSIPITEQQALTHRVEITESFPSLPQTAGRAFKALHDHIDDKPNQIIDSHLAKVTTTAQIGGKRRTLRVLGVANPQIDHYRLARALLALSTADVDGQLLKKAKKLGRRKTR
jgi:hypothetical protein